MEEELNYSTVIFKNHDNSINEEVRDLDIIYDEVMSEQQTKDPNHVKPENEQKVTPRTALKTVTAGLVIICFILASVIIALIIQFNGVLSEQRRENINLTAQIGQLWTEKTDLQRQTEELTRERDGLNWTMGMIMEYENFPVKDHCPQKVCKPCPNGWLPFQSKCYFFEKSNYLQWKDSREQCRRVKADLVVIDTREEQEFITKHAVYYYWDGHGYWIGLSKNMQMDSTMWVDGRSRSLTFWIAQQDGYNAYCVQTLPHSLLANWNKQECSMRNGWICEKRPLIKLD